MSQSDPVSQQAAAVLHALEEKQQKLIRDQAALEAADNELARIFQEADRQYGVSTLEELEQLYAELTGEVEQLTAEARALIGEEEF